VPRTLRSTPLAWCAADPGPMKTAKKMWVRLCGAPLKKRCTARAQRLDLHGIAPVTHACVRLASPARDASIAAND